MHARAKRFPIRNEQHKARTWNAIRENVTIQKSTLMLKIINNISAVPVYISVLREIIYSPVLTR